MIIKADTHVHSLFSFDGKFSMQEMVLTAIEKAINYIYFTEHFDVGTNKYDYKSYDYAAFSNEVDRLNGLYGESIIIKKGIEIGEPYAYIKQTEQVLKNKYDYVIGSIHQFDGHTVAFKDVGEDANAFSDRFYHETLKLSMCKNINSIAHLDHIRRGVGFDKWDKILLAEIFKNMIKNDIALEINSSGIRRTKEDAFPNLEKISLYAECGGEKIVIGSDAHRVNEVAGDFEIVKKSLKQFSSLKNGIFVNRMFVEV